MDPATATLIAKARRPELARLLARTQNAILKAELDQQDAAPLRQKAARYEQELEQLAAPPPAQRDLFAAAPSAELERWKARALKAEADLASGVQTLVRLTAERDAAREEGESEALTWVSGLLDWPEGEEATRGGIEEAIEALREPADGEPVGNLKEYVRLHFKLCSEAALPELVLQVQEAVDEVAPGAGAALWELAQLLGTERHPEGAIVAKVGEMVSARAALAELLGCEPAADAIEGSIVALREDLAQTAERAKARLGRAEQERAEALAEADHLRKEVEVLKARLREGSPPPPAELTVVPDEPPAKDPLSVSCPQCGAHVGEKCTNYSGKGCAPHRERLAIARGEVSELACNHEADQGGARGSRHCTRDPGHKGKHAYKEPPAGEKWLRGGKKSVRTLPGQQD